MESEISSFIRALFEQNLNFMKFGTAVLLIITFTMALLTTWEIQQGIIYCKDLLKDYLKKPDSYQELSKKLHIPAFRLHPFNFVLRTIGNIIKEL